ncbi:MAG TPA: HDIG domain-containing protein [Phycisphaerae bacterium]|nr:HDIG domain-containing protein [Phycisphaerae bacterium]
MAQTGKSTFRRRQVRRQKAERTASVWERFRSAVGLWPVFVAIVFAVAATAIVLYGKQSLSYAVGQQISQAITARVDFNWVDDARTEENRQAARAAASSCYRINHKLIDEIASALQTLYQDAKAAESAEAFIESAGKAGWEASPGLFSDLRARMDEPGAQAYAGWVESLRGLLRSRYTYRTSDSEDRRPVASGPTVRVFPNDPRQPEATGEEPIEVDRLNLVPISNASLMELLAGELIRRAGFSGPALQPAVAAVLTRRLTAEPLLQYDRARTEEAMRQMADAVEPVVISFKRGQPIVSPAAGGEALVLDNEHLAILKAEHEHYRDLLAGDDPAAGSLREQVYLERAGLAVIMVILSVGLFLHVGLYQRRILEVRTRTVALVALVLGTLAVARLIDIRLQREELTLLPGMIVAACLAIAYPRRFAGGTMAIVALLVVLTVRGGIGLLVTLLVGLSTTVYLLEDIRSRTQIISAGLLTGVAVFVVTFAFGLIDRQGVGFAAAGAGLAGGSAVGAALVVQGVLPFIERAFKIATSMTLLEWSSADRPLLQRLAREAPGTYNHSLVLGTMAEAACDAIGANGLLVRVGALYHDIGKIHKSDYYAENQEASISRHENLAASMSLLIILGHVKDGIELAREYGLPKVLHSFISEHHGTTVVRYFHHKATEEQPKKASGKHDREVSEAEFRYPGPKPRSRESAVLMLCDGVEGAVRALAEPTAGRIESVVHQVLMDRLNDGQFGNCEITLKELQTVEESLVKSLCTFYHGRVTYPKAAPGKGETGHSEQGEPGERKRA